LAVKLGHANVDGMLRAMSAKQFRDWETYAQIEPFGEMRQDYRIASVVAMIFNMAVKSEDRKPIKEFLLPFGEDVEKSRQTPEQMERMAKWIALCYSVGAKDL
jgi:hypothetical protein